MKPCIKPPKIWHRQESYPVASQKWVVLATFGRTQEPSNIKALFQQEQPRSDEGDAHFVITPSTLTTFPRNGDNSSRGEMRWYPKLWRRRVLVLQSSNLHNLALTLPWELRGYRRARETLDLLHQLTPQLLVLKLTNSLPALGVVYREKCARIRLWFAAWRPSRLTR